VGALERSRGTGRPAINTATGELIDDDPAVAGQERA
jgi:hypothetical protein